MSKHNRQAALTILVASLALATSCKSSVSGEEERGTVLATRNDAGEGLGVGEQTAMGGTAARSIALTPECADFTEEAFGIISSHCTECHGNGQMQGGFSSVLDVPAMIMQGRIIPGQ